MSVGQELESSLTQRCGAESVEGTSEIRREPRQNDQIDRSL